MLAITVPNLFICLGKMKEERNKVSERSDSTNTQFFVYCNEMFSSIFAGVIQRLQEYYKTPYCGVLRAHLCTTVDHYAGSYGDKGWGCGYRNFQMLLSSLVTEEMYCKILFNGKYTQMSHVMRKPDFCFSNCASDQCLCFRYTDSTIPLLAISEISSL